MEPNPGDIFNEGFEAGYKAALKEAVRVIEGADFKMDITQYLPKVRAWRSYQTGKKENRVIKDTHSHCKKRENHLLRIIEVWKKRYLDLKKRINPNQP